MFTNREEAGRLLAQELSALRDDADAILLALPRGGVVVAFQMSLSLHLPLDVLVTRKIGAPGNPEYALGAVSETGAVYWNREAAETLLLSEPRRQSAVRAQQQEIARRVVLYRQGRPFPELTDRTVILVDDGLATGATFFASVAAIRQKFPRRVLGAIPVAPQSAAHEAQSLLDQLIVLDVPEPFYAVGNFYDDFTQVNDREVLRCLHSAREALLTAQPRRNSPPREATEEDRS
ncbi:MAG TPA: phosphoribosyltransferase [Nitrospira sp.]|jgi:putative phosphoribosyl transferase|nr:phosphoribosyltransferase [Nitrospira sp.]